jgi:hypothetical protein
MGWKTVPDFLFLVGINTPLLAVMQKHMQHNIFAHALGEVTVIHPHNGNVGRKGRVFQYGINPGTQ